MNEIDCAMLIKADAENNNNKFYELKLFDDGTIKARFGRVGGKGQHKTYNGGRNKFDKIITDKLRPENSRKKGGYSRANVIIGNTTKTSEDLGSIARRQIKYSNCKQTEKLISQLVSWNVHEIAAKSTMKVNLGTGNIELPSGMGVLTPGAISNARDLLHKISRLKDKRSKQKNKWTELVNNYLALVPQVIPTKRGWIDTIYSRDEEISAQENLLNSLEVTLSTVDTSPMSKVFDLQLVKITDSKIINHVKSIYNSTRRTMHSSYSLNVKNVYEISIGHMNERFEKCPIDNVMELWHGTGVGNILSILKNGLIIPKHASHGRAFGNGVYFSDQSTKALNYAAGYWDGVKNKNCFMFLADVKVGKCYVPKRGYGRKSLPVKGYNSTFAKAGESGVMNNEIIVYDLSQINIKYLVEFA